MNCNNYKLKGTDFIFFYKQYKLIKKLFSNKNFFNIQNCYYNVETFIKAWHSFILLSWSLINTSQRFDPLIKVRTDQKWAPIDISRTD